MDTKGERGEKGGGGTLYIYLSPAAANVGMDGWVGEDEEG